MTPADIEELEKIAILLIEARNRLEAMDRSTEKRRFTQAHGAISRAHGLVSERVRQAKGERKTA